MVCGPNFGGSHAITVSFRINTEDLTCQDVSLIHELSAQQCHPISLPLFQHGPDMVSRTWVKTSSWFVENQNLENGELDISIGLYIMSFILYVPTIIVKASSIP